MKTRSATHAGSWYESDQRKLDQQLSEWLAAVDASQVPEAPFSVIDGRGASTSNKTLQMPVPDLKAIIAPHAGYSYSGPAAAWAYKCIDPYAYDRVVILGPSHHVYLDGCALSGCDRYATPLGNLTLDKDTLCELRATGKFADDMDRSTDEDEHSIEMHLPYIRKVFERQQDGVKIVPILVGSISTSKEAAFGQLLAPYLADERTLFVVSSDFCHWGSRFSYTHYRASPNDRTRSLSARDKLSAGEVPIHMSIRALDGEAIAKLTYPQSLPQPDARALTGKNSTAAPSNSSSHPRTAKEAQEEFAAYLRETKNTICGRHPIGVLLGALAALESRGTASQLAFTRYEQSSACEAPRDSSVSYASAYARVT